MTARQARVALIPGKEYRLKPNSGQQPPRPAQAATVSLTVPPVTAMLRLATYPQLAVSSTLLQLPPRSY